LLKLTPPEKHGGGHPDSKISETPVVGIPAASELISDVPSAALTLTGFFDKFTFKP
jgi:hypothetical protein